MKTNVLNSLFWMMLLILGASSCKNPEEFHPNLEKNGITNITASFPDDERDENKFTSEIDYEKRLIKVIFPYNYPRLSDNILDPSMLKKVKVVATLENNVYISPKLLYMDLTKENVITVKTQGGDDVEYKVVAEIRKSSECAISKFELSAIGVAGVINETEKTISLIALEPLGKHLANLSISHGASVSPDPRTEELNYDEPQKLVVTAQNGVDKAVYTVQKQIPNKIDAGFRANSVQLLWTKKLSDLGLEPNNMVTGMAVTNDYVVINQRANPNAIYLNAKSGEKEGAINISSISGSLTNFYVTSDNNDNILFCNLTTKTSNVFTIWRMNGVNESLEKYIVYESDYALGRKFSVQGNLDKNAIITAPCYGTNGTFLRWKVVNGSLVSAEPEKVTINGLGNWGFNADVVNLSDEDETAGYFASFYADPRALCWIDGTSNNIKSKGPDISPNWIQNAVDCITFNKSRYVAALSANPWTWGTDDNVYVFDLGSGSLSTHAMNFGADGLNVNGKYGAKALGLTNPNGTADVKFQVSKDGYYLYLYFLFTNGYVGCVRCDCIDL